MLLKGFSVELVSGEGGVEDCVSVIVGVDLFLEFFKSSTHPSAAACSFSSCLLAMASEAWLRVSLIYEQKSCQKVSFA